MTTNYHTAILPDAPADAATFNGPDGQLDAQLTTQAATIAALIAGTTPFTQLNIGGSPTVTIAAGAITVTTSQVLVDTEAAASADDLDVINGGASGDILVLHLANNAHQVRIRNNGGGVGNIRTSSLTDVWMTDRSKSILFIYDGTQLLWLAFMMSTTVRSLLGAAIPITTEQILFPQEVVRVTDGNNGNNIQMVHVQPRPSVRGHFFEQASNATYASVGIAAGTNSGAGALSATTGAQAPSDVFTNQNIALAAATLGGRKSTTFNIWRRQHNPYFYTKMRPRTNALNLRYWIGLCQAQVTNVDTLAAGTAGFYFRYSTVLPDSFWMAICNDGAAQSGAVSTGVAFAIDTDYEFEIWVDSANGLAYFSVNGSTPVTINTNLPSVTQDLGWTVSGISNGVAAKDIAIARIYGEFG